MDNGLPQPHSSLALTQCAVLEKILAYTLTMRDLSSRRGRDDQWTRYAYASTVIEEVLANGWDANYEAMP